MMSLYKTNCDQAQEEASNPAALELEFSYLFRELQQETGLGSEELTALLDEIGRDTEQVLSAPSQSSKNSESSDYHPSTSQSTADCSSVPPATTDIVSRKRTLDEREEQFPLPPLEEILEFLEEQETEQVASTQSNSVLCPSPKRAKLSNDPPYWLTAAYVPSPPTRKMNLDEEPKPYVKKPPNAFMLYRAEQGQMVALELGNRDSARTNAELGRRWNMLSEQEKVQYFEKAHEERRAHQAKYPDWSPVHNYRKKVRRRNRAAPSYTVFPANQQPGPYAATPTSFRPQAPYHQGPYNQAWGPSKEPLFPVNHQPANDQTPNDEDQLFTPNALLNVAHEAQGFIQGLLEQPFNL